MMPPKILAPLLLARTQDRTADHERRHTLIIGLIELVPLTCGQKADAHLIELNHIVHIGMLHDYQTS